MKVLFCLVGLLGLAIGLAARDANAESQIRNVLMTQVAAWNKGDVPEFVTTYAPDCTFVGKQVQHGRDQLLARYKKAYPTRDAMGTLTFGDLDVRMLTADVAVVTGAWHLDRGEKGGGPIGGWFSLVLQKKDGAWKIALDHTS